MGKDEWFEVRNLGYPINATPKKKKKHDAIESPYKRKDSNGQIIRDTDLWDLETYNFGGEKQVLVKLNLQKLRGLHTLQCTNV